MYVSLNSATCVVLNFYLMDNLEINNKEKKQTAFNLNFKKKTGFHNIMYIDTSSFTLVINLTCPFII